MEALTITLFSRIKLSSLRISPKPQNPNLSKNNWVIICVIKINVKFIILISLLQLRIRIAVLDEVVAEYSLFGDLLLF